MATLVPAGSSWNRSLQEMGQKWQQVSGGKVVLKLYAGGVAGDDADVVRKMRLGTLNAGLLATTGLADIDRSVLALQIPDALRGLRRVPTGSWTKMTPGLDAQFDAKGFVVLAWVDGGWAHFFTKTPARTPEELKTAKLFTWAGDDKYTELWKGAGFNAIPLPATEISTALQTGLVNAICTTPQVAAAHAVVQPREEHDRRQLGPSPRGGRDRQEGLGEDPGRRPPAILAVTARDRARC